MAPPDQTSHREAGAFGRSRALTPVRFMYPEGAAAVLTPIFVAPDPVTLTLEVIMSVSEAGSVLWRPEPRPPVQARETRAGIGASGLLRITVRRGADRDVVALSGEVDVATAPELASTIHRLLSEGRTDILIDQGAVTYMDGAALRALIAATSDATHAGGSLWVTENSLCSRLLAITGETHRLNITAGPIAHAFLGGRASE